MALKNEIFVDYKVKPILVKDEILKVNYTNNNNSKTTSFFPELTKTNIQKMIKKKKNEQVKNLCNSYKRHPVSNEISMVKKNSNLKVQTKQILVKTIPSHLTYLLSKSNQLYLIENLSKKGINDASQIINTAENILFEHTKLSFNELLDGVIYRLVSLPEKQKRQKSTNWKFPMKIENEIGNVINSLDIKKEMIKHGLDLKSHIKIINYFKIML